MNANFLELHEVSGALRLLDQRQFVSNTKSMKHKLLKLLFLLIILPFTAFAKDKNSKFKTETQVLHVRGEIQYRCYAGHEGKKNITDDFTQGPCDNKTINKNFIDKDITIELKEEATPADSEIAGSWNESFLLNKRKFNIAFNLFKLPANPKPYRLGIYVSDDEPTSRQTDFYTQIKSLIDMNVIEIEHRSKGKKEEISFTVKISSASSK